MSEKVSSTEKVAEVIQQRYVDTFVKCAKMLNIEPTSQDELQDMLKIASGIRKIQESQEAGVQKSASAGVIKVACEDLYAIPLLQDTAE